MTTGTSCSPDGGWLRMSRADATQRLRSARGHLDGVIRMLDEHRFCTDVLYQLKAVERALELSKRAILDEHLHVCVHDPARGVDSDEFVDELLNALYGGRPPGTARYYTYHAAGSTEPDLSAVRSSSTPPARWRCSSTEAVPPLAGP